MHVLQQAQLSRLSPPPAHNAFGPLSPNPTFLAGRVGSGRAGVRPDPEEEQGTEIDTFPFFPPLNKKLSPSPESSRVRS